VILNILSPKLEAFDMDPDTKYDDFLEDNSNDFDQIWVIYGSHVPKHIFRNITVCIPDVETRNASVLNTCFTRHLDFLAFLPSLLGT
jgi:hypothetical protein